MANSLSTEAFTDNRKSIQRASLRKVIKEGASSSDEDMTETTTSSETFNNSFASAGHSGYGRPDDFVGSPTQGKDGNTRRSWRPKSNHSPKNSSSSSSSNTTPKNDVPKIPWKKAPKSAPAGPSHKLSRQMNQLQNLKLPLGSTHKPPRPPSVRSIDAASGHSKNTFFEDDPSTYATPETSSKDKVAATTGLVAAISLAESPTEGETGRAPSHELATQNSSPSSVDYGSVTGMMNPSPATRRRWKMKEVDPEKLPPAFRAAHRASTRTIGSSNMSPRSPRRYHIDPSRLEKVVPREKSLHSPSKLKRTWPPVPPKSQTGEISRKRASGVVREKTVYDRISTFEVRRHSESAGQGDSPRNVEDPFSFLPQSPAASHMSELYDNYLQAGPDIPLPLTAPLDVAVLPQGAAVEAEGSYRSRVPTPSTSLRITWGGPTFYNIEGRPLYYDHKFIDADGNEIPLEPLLLNRFEATGGGMAPRAPSRVYDGWSDEEWESDEDESKTKPVKRPDVWVTPMEDSDGSSGETPDNQKWRVKRVWNIAEIDEHEPEHAVGDDGLMDKVKSLLGVPTEGSYHGVTPGYDASASLWKVKKVLDVEGEIQATSTTQKLSETGILDGFQSVASEAASIQSMEEAASEAPVFVDKLELNETNHTMASSMAGSADMLIVTEDADAAAESPFPSTIQVEGTVSTSRPGDFTTELDDEPKPEPPVEKKKKKKKKNKYDDIGCIGDLLSPPSITLFRSASDHSSDFDTS